MRGDVPLALPACARDRLQELQVARLGAEDAARSAAQRLNNLSRDADEQMRVRLAGERDRQQHRHRELSLLVNRVQQWIVEQRPGGWAALRPTPPVAVELGRGETLSDAVEAARAEIDSLRRQLAATRQAPLPPTEQQRLAEEYVAGLMGGGRPQQINFHRDRLTLRWRDDVVASRDDVLAMLAWVAPERVHAALARDIREQPVRPDAMPAAERLRRVAELETQLLDLERREEALVLRAAGDGLEILRRPDASPVAVLGVAVVATSARVA
jgi:hypothetical protein